MYIEKTTIPLQVLVYANGERAEEYADPELALKQYNEDDPDSPRPLESCYIESRLNGEFWVQVRLDDDEDTKWTDVGWRLDFHLSIDSTKPDHVKRPITAETMDKRVLGWDFVSHEIVGTGGSANTAACFKFGFVGLDESGRWSRYYPVTSIEMRVTGIIQDTHGWADNDLHDLPVEDIAIFRFEVRSRAELEQESIIPRTPNKGDSPDNLVAHDPRHERLQSLRKALSQIEVEANQVLNEISTLEIELSIDPEWIVVGQDVPEDARSLEPVTKKQCRDADDGDGNGESEVESAADASHNIRDFASMTMRPLE